MASPVATFHDAILSGDVFLRGDDGGELADLVREGRIVFSLDFLERYRMSVLDRDGRTIKACVVPLERLWGMAYSYTSIHNFLAEHQARDAEASPLTFPRSLTASLPVPMKMLGWAECEPMKAETDDVTRIPDDLVAAAVANSNPDIAIADALFESGLRFVLARQSSHFVLDHSGSETSGHLGFKQEREADEWALDRLMGSSAASVPDTDADLQKTVGGIVVALAWPIVRGIYRFMDRSPPIYRDADALRIVFLLESRFADRPDHFGWSFLETILSLHLKNQGRLAEVRLMPSARDQVVEMVGVIFPNLEMPFLPSGDSHATRPRRKTPITVASHRLPPDS